MLCVQFVGQFQDLDYRLNLLKLGVFVNQRSAPFLCQGRYPGIGDRQTMLGF